MPSYINGKVCRTAHRYTKNLQISQHSTVANKAQITAHTLGGTYTCRWFSLSGSSSVEA